MMKRDPGSAPDIGSRVPYIIMAGPKGAKKYELAEDPMYAIKHGIQPDPEYYVEKVHKEMVKMVEPLGESGKALVARVDAAIKEQRKHRVQHLSFKSPIMQQMVLVKRKCIFCNGLLPQGRSSYHLECARPGELDKKQGEMKHGRDVALSYSVKLWNQCRLCQGKNPNERLDSCSNNDCTIFYTRESATKTADKVKLRYENMKNECESDKIDKDLSW